MSCAVAVMAAYADRQAGHITHEQMTARLAPVRERTKRRLVWTAANAPGEDARKKARELLRHEEKLWTFLADATVPVTNNLCERLLRYAVILRKLSYGNDSQAGGRFLTALLTTCATLQLQRRDVYAFLTEAVDAHFRSQPAPSLLTTPSPS